MTPQHIFCVATFLLGVLAVAAGAFARAEAWRRRLGHRNPLMIDMGLMQVSHAMLVVGAALIAMCLGAVAASALGEL